MLTDRRDCPVAVAVFQGNTSDSKTLLPQVERAQSQFGIRELVMVGDRGMITGQQIETLRVKEGLEWITALRPEAIRQLVKEGALQLGLFDERNLFELSHPDYPEERLVACRNPVLAARRAQKRRSLMEATERELSRVRQMVERGRVRGQDQIRGRPNIARNFGLKLQSGLLRLCLFLRRLDFSFHDKRRKPEPLVIQEQDSIGVGGAVMTSPGALRPPSSSS